VTSIAVGIPTVGNSAKQVDAVLTCAKRFAGRDLRYIVSDDRTPDGKYLDELKQVCKKHNVEFTQPPEWGGMLNNFNHLFKVTTEDWVFILDDGMLVQKNWIEGPIRVIDSLGDTYFDTTKGPAQIGVISQRAIMPHDLVATGLIPSRFTWQQWVLGCLDRITYPFFYDIKDEFFSRYSEWVGGITFQKVYGELNKWYDKHPEIKNQDASTRLPILTMPGCSMITTGYCDLTAACVPVVRRKFWEEMGGFSKGFTFYEFYLEAKAYLDLNWVCLFINSYPFIHLQGLGCVNLADMCLKYNIPDTNRNSTQAIQDEFHGTLEGVAARIAEKRTPEMRNRMKELVDPLLADIL
jgi:hypothetical protein